MKGGMKGMMMKAAMMKGIMMKGLAKGGCDGKPGKGMSPKGLAMMKGLAAMKGKAAMMAKGLGIGKGPWAGDGSGDGSAGGGSTDGQADGSAAGGGCRTLATLGGGGEMGPEAYMAELQASQLAQEALVAQQQSAGSAEEQSGLAMALMQAQESEDDQAAAALSGLSELPAEKQQELQQAAMAAQQAQLLQQIQFRTQWHQFETQQLAASGEVPSRFRVGFRPLQLCKRNLRGLCPDGDSCRFAHTLEELHPLSPENPARVLLPAGTNALAEQSSDNKKIEPAYRMQTKRAICNRLARGGCMLGKQCPFAHSEEELGTTCRVLTGRVKAKLCKHWDSGKCIYGMHCVNAHGMDEVGTPMPDYLVQPSKSGSDRSGGAGPQNWK